MRQVLIIGGAPRVQFDAIRYMTVEATGRTAIRLNERLAGHGVTSQLLLSRDCHCEVPCSRYRDRADLEEAVGTWITDQPDGLVISSAAINDYQLAKVSWRRGDEEGTLEDPIKIPSGCDELRIELRPDAKLIDQLRLRWGHRGPLIAFKYEAATTVIESAEKLRRRTGAALVVANSLCGRAQALVERAGPRFCGDREDLLEALVGEAERLVAV